MLHIIGMWPNYVYECQCYFYFSGTHRRWINRITSVCRGRHATDDGRHTSDDIELVGLQSVQPAAHSE